MDYKKKYENALEWARQVINGECGFIRKDVEEVFPELKESENERIRKGMLQGFKDYGEPEYVWWEGVKVKECIAWLEKQGKETSWKPSKEEMDVLYGLAYITNQYDEHKEDVITRLYQDLKREFFNGSSYENMFPNTEDGVRRRSTIQVLEYARSLDTYNQYGKADIDKNIAWLENQGNKVVDCQQNHQDIHPHGCIVLEDFNGGEGFYKLNLDYLNKEQVKEVETLVSKWNLTDEDIKNCIGLCLTDVDEQRFKDFNTNLRDCLAWLEKQGEQNYEFHGIAEPRPAKGTLKKLVDEIEKQKFKVGDWIVDKSGLAQQVLDFRGGIYTCTYNSFTTDCESNYHLWTIEDAKNGDILVSTWKGHQYIYIFKNIEHNAIISHIFYYPELDAVDMGVINMNNTPTIPATNEQRNLLFSKIKDEGWSWNPETKELSQSKVTKTSDQEWSEEDEE